MKDPYAHVVLPKIRLREFASGTFALEYEDPISGFVACFVRSNTSKDTVMNVYGSTYAPEHRFKSREEAVAAAEEFKKAFRARYANATPIKEEYL